MGETDGTNLFPRDDFPRGSPMELDLDAHEYLILAMLLNEATKSIVRKPQKYCRDG